MPAQGARAAALRAGLLLLALLAAGLFAAGSLSAEPYFSVREGYKCSKCHVNKTGGGMRTDYAQVYMQTRMTMDAGHGHVGMDREFSNGALNEFFSFGADVRASVSRDDLENADPTWQFGRRDSCVGCHEAQRGGGKRAEIYARMEPMPGKASIVVSQSLIPVAATREAYGLLDDLPMNGYVKAGTFRLPSMLQNSWDDPLLHTAPHPESGISAGTTGLVGLTPSRGKGIEMGIEPGPFSVSLSITNPQNPDELRAEKRKHFNAYAVGSLGLIGLTYYDDPISKTLQRTYTAVYAGFNLGRITALGSVDQFTDEDPTATANAETDRRAILGELDFLVTRGQNIKLQYEAFDPNLDQDNDIQDRTSLIYEPFINRYLQMRAGVRKYVAPSTDPPAASPANQKQMFVELHFMF